MDLEGKSNPDHSDEDKTPKRLPLSSVDRSFHLAHLGAAQGNKIESKSLIKLLKTRLQQK